MRVLVAGATGALGRRLVPLLIAAGHSVAGLTRSPAKFSLLQRMGAEAIVADALDPSAIKKMRSGKQGRKLLFTSSLLSGRSTGENRWGIRRDQPAAKRGHG
jgi:2-alkyl-3-oxoalkanoate reductase